MAEFDTTAVAAVSVADSSDLVTEVTTPKWGASAPRGAKAVLNRIVKDGANVPLFLGQTLVNSLRDTGYNNTTSAICEHVDNSVESGATEIRIYFIEAGRKQERVYHVAVLDNGKGMAPNVLKASSSFGGSMRFDNRGGIGRYGMGMKAAALSISPVLEVYSWQEVGAYYNVTLDVEAIGQDTKNVIFVPDPQLLDMMPTEVLLALNTPMVYPKNPGETQTIFCRDASEMKEKLGETGTLVFMPNCDRLTYRKISSLVDHATKEMSRVYRRQLDKGLKLFINNRAVEPFDPMYQMKSARHTKVPELLGKEMTSRLVQRWSVKVPVAEGEEVTSEAVVRLYFLPIADWSSLPRKVLKNDLKVFDVGGISFMRGDREVDLKDMDGILGKRGTRDSWWRIEIDFHGDLDEAFGVAMNKQGVRPKSYVRELLFKTIQDDLREVRKAVEKHWSEQASADSASHVNAAEQRANEAEALQSTVMRQPSPRDEAEQKQLDDNLRVLAVTLKREGESDDQAFERVKATRYITTNVHNEDGPFYRVDNRFGKVILTINTAHPFYERLYRPLAAVAKKVTASDSGGPTDDETVDGALAEECSQVLTALQLLLFSLGRTQAEMTANDATGETQKLFDKLRKQWSLNLDGQLAT